VISVPCKLILAHASGPTSKCEQKMTDASSNELPDCS